MKKYNQLKYCLRTAYNEGINEHPQIVMKNLGYKLIGSVPQTMGDCWWFTVEKIIKPLPPYLRKTNYDFDYWHNSAENKEEIKHSKNKIGEAKSLTINGEKFMLN